MAFNPEPNKQAVEVLFSQKRLHSNHPPLFFNRSMILKVDAHKHLGLILDSKLLFVNHINEKIKLAKKGIGVLKYLSQYLALISISETATNDRSDGGSNTPMNDGENCIIDTLKSTVNKSISELETKLVKLIDTKLDEKMERCYCLVSR